MIRVGKGLVSKDSRNFFIDTHNTYAKTAQPLS